MAEFIYPAAKLVFGSFSGGDVPDDLDPCDDAAFGVPEYGGAIVSHPEWVSAHQGAMPRNFFCIQDSAAAASIGLESRNP